MIAGAVADSDSMRSRLCRRYSSLASIHRQQPLSHAALSGWQQLGWERLLLERGWLRRAAYEAATQAEKEKTLKQISRRLSFPITVASAWGALGLPTQGSVHLCVLGAREEADEVSMAAWMEICVLAGVEDLRLSMIGPEAIGSSRSMSTDDGSMSVQQTAPSPTAFVDSPLGRAVMASMGRPPAAGGISDGAAAGSLAPPVGASSPDERLPDAYVLFNPGLHAGKYFWRPSIELALSTGQPILLTAYHEQVRPLVSTHRPHA